jgi:hypothetical protein
LGRKYGQTADTAAILVRIVYWATAGAGTAQDVDVLKRALYAMQNITVMEVAVSVDNEASFLFADAQQAYQALTSNGVCRKSRKSAL